MEFALGTDMQRAQLDVISRLNRVSGCRTTSVVPCQQLQQQRHPDLLLHPATARRQGEIDDHQALIEARVKPELERIPGVSTVDIEGINERQIQIRFDPTAPPSWGGDPGARQPGNDGLGCRPAPSTSDAGSTSCALPVAMTWRPWGQGGGLARRPAHLSAGRCRDQSGPGGEPGAAHPERQHRHRGADLQGERRQCPGGARGDQGQGRGAQPGGAGAGRPAHGAVV